MSYAVLAVPQADHSRYRTRVGESHIPQSSFRFPISLLYPLNSLWSSRLYPIQPLIRPEHIGLNNSMRLGSIANKITAKGENIRQSHLLFWLQHLEIFCRNSILDKQSRATATLGCPKKSAKPNKWKDGKQLQSKKPKNRLNHWFCACLVAC